MVTASYPSGIIAFTNKQDRIDVVDDDHINQLQSEVVALQTYSGTNPHGDRASIADRMNAMLNPSGYLISSAGVPQPTAPGFFWYDSSADQMKIIKGDGTVKSVGGSLSNVIFSWISSHANGLDYPALVQANTWQGTSADTVSLHQYYYNNNVSTTFTLIFPLIAWEKVAGINTLFAVVNHWSGDTQWSQFSMGVGSSTAVGGTHTGTGAVSGTQVTSLDVSALDIGTMYDIEFRLRRQSTSSRGYMGNVSIFGQ